MAKKNKLEFPLEVEFGNATVTVYKTVSAKGYVSYQIADYSSGKRKLLSFSDQEEALKEANDLAKKIHEGEAKDVLRGSDVRAFHTATAKLPEGLDLLTAVTRYVDAYKILGGDHVLEAARFFNKRHPVNLPRMMVKEVYDEFIAAKEARLKGGAGKRALSIRTTDDYRSRCGRFAEDFKCHISEISSSQVQEWLEGLGLSDRTFMNYRRNLKVMFEFAKRKGYLPKDHDEMDRVERRDDEGGEVVIYTPTEVARLLAAAKEDYVCCLAIGAFAGLRSAEIERLDWRDIDLADCFIEVKKGNTKTASRRIVPISDNLAAWLAPHKKVEGKLWKGNSAEFYRAERETAAATQTETLKAQEWKRNALRHSFCSYRLAKVQNVPQVAYEAGNSPAIIHRHYHQLVRPKEAEAWFAIAPPSQKAEGKIIQLAAAAAATAEATPQVAVAKVD